MGSLGQSSAQAPLPYSNNCFSNWLRDRSSCISHSFSWLWWKWFGKESIYHRVFAVSILCWSYQEAAPHCPSQVSFLFSLLPKRPNLFSWFLFPLLVGACLPLPASAELCLLSPWEILSHCLYLGPLSWEDLFSGWFHRRAWICLMQNLFMADPGQVALSLPCLDWTPGGTGFFYIVPKVASWLNKLHSPSFSTFPSLQLVWKANTGPQRWKRSCFRRKALLCHVPAIPGSPLWLTADEQCPWKLSSLRTEYSWRSHLSAIAAACLSGTYGCCKDGS